MSEASTIRKQISEAKRVVIKVGTRVLVQSNGRPNHLRLQQLVKSISGLKREGREVILVSSGAVASGYEALKLKKRPQHLPDLQLAAAVGQTRLMSEYQQLFKKERCTIGQVLLTHEDLKHRDRHLNARNTFMQLLHHGIIPIVNENDVVSVDEIKFGDNDELAALVSILTDADLLIMLTSVNGFLRATGKKQNEPQSSYYSGLRQNPQQAC